MEQKQYSPSMTFTEREVRKTKIGTLGTTKVGALLTSANGPGNKIINITSEEELVEIFGKPTEYNAKDWLVAQSYLKYASDLYVVRPVAEDWENPSIIYSLDPSEPSDPPTSENSDMGDMYNEDIADNTLFTASLTGGDIIQFVEKYVNCKNETGVLVCSSTTDYDFPIMINNMAGDTDSARAYVNNIVPIALAGGEAKAQALTGLDNAVSGYYHPLSTANHGDAYLFKTTTNSYFIVRLNKVHTGFTNSVTTWTLAEAAGCVDYIVLNTLADGDYSIFDIYESEKFFTYTVASNVISSWPANPDSYQPPYWIPHKNSYANIDYIIKQEFVSSLYDSSTKKLKTFRDITQKNLNFVRGDIAVYVIRKNLEGLWELGEEPFTGNYDDNSRKSSGLTNSIRKIINKESKYIYCIINPTYTDFVNAWSTNGLSLQAPSVTTGTVIITHTAPENFESPAVVGNTSLVESAEDAFGENGIMQPDILLSFNNQANSGWLDTMPIIANKTGFSLALVGLDDETGIVGAKDSKIVTDLIDLLGNARTDTSFGALTEFNTYTMVINEMKYYYDRYNDKYRWISIIGDIAGKLSVNDFVNGAQSAIAGTERGKISNYARLLYTGNYNQNLMSKNGINCIIYDYDLGYSYLFDYITNTQQDLITKELNVRRMIIKLKHFLKRILKGNYFEYNNVEVRDKTLFQIGQVFEAFKMSGGLYDYELICNDENNNADIINQQKFVLDIKLQPGRLIKHIVINIINYDMGINIREIE